MKALKPPQRLQVSEWADKYRTLSRESSAEPGTWNTDRAPYQREMMDAFTDVQIKKVIIKSSAQIGKSELLLNMLGYAIDIDPGPMMLIQPTVDTAEDFSKRRIAPMIRDTPRLSEKVAQSKSRDLKNTILKKAFPGGILTMTGSNSPAGLASIPSRYIFGDEIDRWAASAGSEGDPIALVEKRAITFYNSKFVYTSTPTIKGASRIEEEYLMGTQEQWRVECPHCKGLHYIKFNDIKFDYNTIKRQGRQTYIITKTWWQCPSCLKECDQYELKRQKASWIAQNPDALKNGIRSFELNAFSSPWLKWEEIILDFLNSKGDIEMLKVFYNTMLGESWEDRGDIQSEDEMLERRENYGAELPDGVLVLTCGVDTQDNRLEYEVVGWGKQGESWGIQSGIIMGEPSDEKTWQQLDDILDRVWRFENNMGLVISLTCIDSGGHYTQEVYKQCKLRQSKRVFAVKGSGTEGRPLISKPTNNNIYRSMLFVLGVNAGKAEVMSRLRVLTPGNKYCHFSNDKTKGYDLQYFESLTSERLTLKKTNGRNKYTWQKIRPNIRNEALDCRVYAYAAIMILNPDFDAIESRIKEKPKPKPKNPKQSKTKKSKGINIYA